MCACAYHPLCAAKKGDVGGGTESSSPTATGKGSDEDAAIVAAAVGAAAGSALISASPSTVSVLPHSASSVGSIELIDSD